VIRGDSLVLLDDSNSYWWLVKCVKTDEIGYIPAENIETPYERLARLNRQKNSRPILVEQALIDNPPPVSHDKHLFFDIEYYIASNCEFSGVTIIYLDGQRDEGTPYCDQSNEARESTGSNDGSVPSNESPMEFDSHGKHSPLNIPQIDSPDSGTSTSSSTSFKKGKLRDVIKESRLFSFYKKGDKGGVSNAGKSQEIIVPAATSSVSTLPQALSDEDLSKITAKPLNVIRIFAGLNINLIQSRKR
jgi:hypothetical protein